MSGRPQQTSADFTPGTRRNSVATSPDLPAATFTKTYAFINAPPSTLSVLYIRCGVEGCHSAARNSFHGVASKVSVVEWPYPRMIMATFSISLGSCASTTSTTSNRPVVAQLAFHLTPGQSLLILAETA